MTLLVKESLAGPKITRKYRSGFFQLLKCVNQIITSLHRLGIVNVIRRAKADDRFVAWDSEKIPRRVLVFRVKNGMVDYVRNDRALAVSEKCSVPAT